MTNYTGTYSPEDNKLRLYASARLDAELYKRVMGAGFRYAPKQECFFAPMWTPQRYDLLVELCGEVGDEDKTLAERAEERAERFAGYAANREADAETARKAVHALSDRIPFGQPILVGHHSEGRARRDIARIDAGMSRAVDNWRQSEYWQNRAQRALAHAKYKEVPSVRARRIKTLEAEMRRCERARDEYANRLGMWTVDGLTHEGAVAAASGGGLRLPRKTGDAGSDADIPTAYAILTNPEPGRFAPRTLEEIIAHAHDVYQRPISHYVRWIEHYQNRIAYEKAMLGEQGGFVDCKFDIQPGGMVFSRGNWLVVVRVTRKDGKPVSVSTNARLARVRNIAEITDYKPPTEEAAAAISAATKIPPICNYPGESITSITKEEWDKIPSDYRGMRVIKASETQGAHRVRSALGVFLFKGERDANKSHSYAHVFITDAKRKDPPAAAAAAA